MPQSLPDPFYYLTNFQYVLDWIGQRYADLLDSAEWAFLEDFPALPRASQALLVRMVMRKGEHFRASKLRYAEIGEAPAAVQPLVAQGWVEPAPLLTITALADLLRKDELTASFGVASSLRKSELMEVLQAQFGEAQHSLAAWCPELEDRIYGLRVAALCDRFRLLFFGNLHQDWSEFVLADLGIFQYETVEMLPNSRAFQSPADVDAYLHLWRCSERLQEEESIATIRTDVPTQPYANTWLEGRRAKLLFRLAQQLEKQRDWSGALAIYRDCRYPGARARSIRMLEHCDEYAAALALADAALQAPENEEEQQLVSRMLPRLRRRQGLPRLAMVTPACADEITLSLPADPEQAVELLVRAHLHTSASPVFYVENALINSLFGLLCWPAVFAPVPGAFFHPFQQGPADLYAPDFVARRREHFAACLDRLGNGSYRQAIMNTWQEKQGRLSPFVYWDMLTEELLMLALNCIPATHLRLCFERILDDVKRNRSGFPDLIQFWPEEQRYKMIEVKGPGDRIQDNQQRWLDYFVRHQLPVAVCYVRWCES